MRFCKNFELSNPMEEIEKRQLAEICTRIINEPEKNIDEISGLFHTIKNKGLLHLSLTRVFKSIAPLYRIRLHSDKVKHKNESLSITVFDRKLFKYYNAFVKEICISGSIDSYKSAAELLRILDHFNFADRLVSKVLLGTTKSHAIAKCCIEVLVEKIKNDSNGDVIFLIIDNCLDYRFSHVVVDAMLESQYLEKCVNIRLEKEQFYEKESIERRKRDKSEKSGKGFFAKRFLIGKKERKAEKSRLQLQKEVRQQEKMELDPINEKNYIKTVNAMQRLYFTILKDQNKESFGSTFIGIRKYSKLIRKEFYEGMYTLLLNAIRAADAASALEGILTVLEIYKDYGYDFKRIIDVLFQLVMPFEYSFECELVCNLCVCIRRLFLDISQSKLRVIALVQRLMHCRITRFIPELDRLIKDLEIGYNLEFTDLDAKNAELGDLNGIDIDRITYKPCYEYFLFKKVV